MFFVKIIFFWYFVYILFESFSVLFILNENENVFYSIILFVNSILLLNILVIYYIIILLYFFFIFWILDI